MLFLKFPSGEQIGIPVNQWDETCARIQDVLEGNVKLAKCMNQHLSLYTTFLLPWRCPLMTNMRALSCKTCHPRGPCNEEMLAIFHTKSMFIFFTTVQTHCLDVISTLWFCLNNTRPQFIKTRLRSNEVALILPLLDDVLLRKRIVANVHNAEDGISLDVHVREPPSLLSLARGQILRSVSSHKSNRESLERRLKSGIWLPRPIREIVTYRDVMVGLKSHHKRTRIHPGQWLLLYR